MEEYERHFVFQSGETVSDHRGRHGCDWSGEGAPISIHGSAFREETLNDHRGRHDGSGEGASISTHLCTSREGDSREETESENHGQQQIEIVPRG